MLGDITVVIHQATGSRYGIENIVLHFQQGDCRAVALDPELLRPVQHVVVEERIVVDAHGQRVAQRRCQFDSFGVAVDDQVAVNVQALVAALLNIDTALAGIPDDVVADGGTRAMPKEPRIVEASAQK